MNSGFIESNSIHVKRNTKLFPGTYLSTGPTALLQTYVIVWTTFLAFWFLAEGGWIIFQIFHGHLLFTFLSIHLLYLPTPMPFCLPNLSISGRYDCMFEKVQWSVWTPFYNSQVSLKVPSIIYSSRALQVLTTALWKNMQMYLSSTDEFERQKLVPLSFINI